MTVSFQNPGEIDLRAILFMGVNVKENDNPIGFFGTGLKYAIAVLLRTGHQIEIWQGLNKLSFSVRVEAVRGKDFSLIYMNDRALGITTELGKTWKVWQAFREIYSNMLDEKGQHKIGKHSPSLGLTTIFVTGAEFTEAYRKRADYFITTEPIEVVDDVEIHSGTNVKHLFYRGVRVHESEKPFLRTYNLKSSSIDLTEDRTLKYSFEVNSALLHAILCSNDRSYVEACLTSENYVESDLDFMSRYDEPSETFMEVVEDLRFAVLNRSAFKKWAKHAGKEGEEFELVNLNEFDKKILDKAIDFLVQCEYPVKDYEIKVVKDLGEGIIGLAARKTIYIAHLNFKLGVKQVLLTLFEEWVHLSKGHQDKTRKMQQYLFDEIVSLCERYIYKEPI